jgi:hypothetical protein
MSRSPAPGRSRDVTSGSRSPPERVEETDWSHRRFESGHGPGHRRRAPLAGDPIAIIRPTTPRRTCAGPCEPSRRPLPVDPPVRTSSRPLARRLPSRVLDATNSYLRLVVFG